MDTVLLSALEYLFVFIGNWIKSTEDDELTREQTPVKFESSGKNVTARIEPT